MKKRLDESTSEVKTLSASSKRNRATGDRPTLGGGWRHPRGGASRLHGLRAATDRRYFDTNALRNVGMRSSNGPSIHNSAAGWFSESYGSDSRVPPPRSDQARPGRSAPECSPSVESAWRPPRLVLPSCSTTADRRRRRPRAMDETSPSPRQCQRGIYFYCILRFVNGSSKVARCYANDIDKSALVRCVVTSGYCGGKATREGSP